MDDLGTSIREGLNTYTLLIFTWDSLPESSIKIYICCHDRDAWAEIRSQENEIADRNARRFAFEFVKLQSKPVMQASLARRSSDWDFVQCRKINLEGSVSFEILQDDLLHPVLGGNKLRKLDAVIPHLLENNITDVVSLLNHSPSPFQEIDFFVVLWSPSVIICINDCHTSEETSAVIQGPVEILLMANSSKLFATSKTGAKIIFSWDLTAWVFFRADAIRQHEKRDREVLVMFRA